MSRVSNLSPYLVLFLFLFVSCDFTPSINKKILKAQKLVVHQDYQAAVILYKKILENHPSKEVKIKIYYQLGELHSIYLSNNKEALKYFNLVKKVTNNHLWLVRSEERIGNIYFEYEKDYKKSLASYEKLYSFRPKLEKIDFYQYRIALSLLKLERREEAIKALIEIQSHKNHTYFNDSFYQLGLANFLVKDWKKAILYWNEYIKRESNRRKVVRTKFLIANAFESMEQLKKAYNIYYSILGEYPNTKVVQNRLKSIYARRVARKR